VCVSVCVCTCVFSQPLPPSPPQSSLWMVDALVWSLSVTVIYTEHRCLIPTPQPHLTFMQNEYRHSHQTHHHSHQTHTVIHIKHTPSFTSNTHHHSHQTYTIIHTPHSRAQTQTWVPMRTWWLLSFYAAALVLYAHPHP